MRHALLWLCTCLMACAARTNTVTVTPPHDTDAVATPEDAGQVAAVEPAVDVPRVAPPQLPARKDVAFPSIAKRSLDHGVELNVVEQHALPLVVMSLVVRGAGSASDPVDKPGVANIVGEMLKLGTVHHTASQIVELVEQVGGSLEIETIPGATTLRISVAKTELERSLLLLGELITEPNFDGGEFERLRRRESERVTVSLRDPEYLAKTSMLRELFPGHPYGRIDASLESLGRISHSDVTSFYRAHYVGRAVSLVVTGDVRMSDVASLAQRALSHVRRGNVPALTFPAVPARTAREIVLLDRPDSVQSEIRVADRTMQRGGAGEADLTLANQVLGGDVASRLFMDLREKRGLTYGVYSSLNLLANDGYYAIGTAVRKEVTAEALGAILDHLKRMGESTVPDDELSLARAYLTDSFTLRMETIDAVSSMVETLRVSGLPDDYWTARQTKIQAVTAPQAQTASQQWFSPAHPVVIVVGDASAVQESLRAHGAVRVIDNAGRTLRNLPVSQ